MIIKTAEFIKSSTNNSQCPKDGKPEYAFIGRSNVGKSSLINMLTGYSSLAKTSQKPGKTQLINHFLINQEWYIVDLPGYGYASRGKKMREEFAEMILQYAEHRMELTCLFILIDCRHAPQKNDIDFINKMGELGVPFSLVFTKGDKLSKLALETSVERYKEHLSTFWEELPTIFITSSTKKEGREELLNYIEQINSSIQTA